METFEQFMRRREAAASDYVAGEGETVLAMTTEQQPSTFFGPGGNVVGNAAEVRDAHASGAKMFGASGKSRFEIMQMMASGDIGGWAGIQRATVDFQGKVQDMDLRVTELFRREAGEWKLVHRHADFLKKATG